LPFQFGKYIGLMRAQVSFIRSRRKALYFLVIVNIQSQRNRWLMFSSNRFNVLGNSYPNRSSTHIFVIAKTANKKLNMIHCLFDSPFTC